MDPQSSPYATRLALKLVAEAYGEACERTCAALFSHGTQTLRELEASSKLGAADLRTALLVLIQHNCVDCSLHQEQSAPHKPQLPVYVYRAATHRILQALRAPRFLAHIRDETGEELPEKVLQQLLYYGRQSVGQLVEAVLVAYGAGEEEEEEEEDEEGTKPKLPEEAAVWAALALLVQERYVERVPPAPLPPPLQAVHANAQKKKAQPKQGSDEDLEQQRVQAQEALHQRYRNVRHKLPKDWVLCLEQRDGAAGGSEEAPRDDLKAAIAKARSGATPPKRKRIAGSDVAAAAEARAAKRSKAGAGGAVEVKPEPGTSDAGAGDGTAVAAAAAADRASGSAPGVAVAGQYNAQTTMEDAMCEYEAQGARSVLWRVNFAEFNRRFRNARVVQFMNEQHTDPDISAVVEALLYVNLKFESEGKTEVTESLGEEDVVAVVQRRSPGGPSRQSVCQHLRLLAEEDALQFFEEMGHGPKGQQYRVHIGKVLSAIRTMEIQAMITDRFGLRAHRIWKLLFEGGQLEQKAIGETAMVAKEEARELLYGMLKAGYVTLQDIPRSADHAPSRTFYTWRADVGVASAKLALELYRAAGNVYCRLQHDVRHFQAIPYIEAGHVPARMHPEVARMRKVAGALECSLLELDKQIALFVDY